ncbi:MAG: DNA alkylation repair protein, partial [Deltaproteobacteria bacterium]|nr:DNA alkylation repair protein [Deltaproteobacteria bacterium]
MIQKIQQRLSCLADKKRANHSRLFFKTGPGQYGQGDIFRGIRVPVLRKLAAEYRTLSIVEAAELLSSTFHEDRLLALIILVRLFARGNNETRQIIYSLYLDNTQYVNNWDLVDSSAEYIVGA